MEVPGTPVPMKVPPKMITEGEKTFMRITGSAGDCSAIPSHLCPLKNRSTVWLTSHYANMPLLTNANMRMTYTMDLRFHGNTGTDGKVMSLFQDGPQTGGYGTKDGQGGVVNLRRHNGRMTAYAMYANNTKSTWWTWVPPGGHLAYL